ncbi:hypothetical protein [Alkalibacterium olivapovliticus]|uniref:Uncharacterized protein n=1 Tax=Alkalibacterium olivapovliticus TaxID=99907 RepID=A0A2T0VKX0_9LACT|nr:hypothetical protein [Alkalibacterium olivapovliticus]PRY70904.1 hypothetical protein CLV38_1791 [Alkalibacterium olivapovliticus]
MNEQLLQTIKQLEIKKEPEEQTLEVANQSYTKNQLAHFIDRHDLSIAKSWKKAEIVTALTDWMEKARVDLLNSEPELLSFYSQNLVKAERSFDTYNSNLSDSDLERVLLLIDYGLAYNVDGQLWLPGETAGAVSNIEAVPEQQDEADTNQTDAPENKPEQSSQAKKRAQTPPPSVFTEETVAQKKQTRLNYLKKQAKKKKRKKRN